MRFLYFVETAHLSRCPSLLKLRRRSLDWRSPMYSFSRSFLSRLGGSLRSRSLSGELTIAGIGSKGSVPGGGGTSVSSSVVSFVTESLCKCDSEVDSGRAVRSTHHVRLVESNRRLKSAKERIAMRIMALCITAHKDVPHCLRL